MSFQHSLKLNGWMECQAFKWPWKIGISKPLFPNKPTSVKSGSPHCLYEFLHISEFCSLKAHQTCVRGCVILLSLKLLFDFGSPGVSLPSDSANFLFLLAPRKKRWRKEVSIPNCTAKRSSHEYLAPFTICNPMRKTTVQALLSFSSILCYESLGIQNHHANK